MCALLLPHYFVSQSGLSIPQLVTGQAVIVTNSTVTLEED